MTLVNVFHKDCEGGGHLTGPVLEMIFRDEAGELVRLTIALDTFQPKFYHHAG